MNATYSPEDNKLRLYTNGRLSSEDYQKVKSMGFIYAPKQQLFVAPMWTPSREDFLIEFTGEEIGDEDTSLIERQEERAERFENYSEKRASEADSQHEAVKSICEHIPLGQPILIGHHSEKRARKDAERIENGMRKAVKLWETSEYWERRAKGALAHAKYKELPQVRARRIKRIEADARRSEREKLNAEKFLKLWNVENLSYEKALNIANFDHVTVYFTLDKYPLKENETYRYEGANSVWSGLEKNILTVDQAKEICIPCHERTIKHCERWINHFQNRLLYEETMLDQQGGSDLLKPKERPKQLPLCNYKTDFVIVENRWNPGQFDKIRQIEMSSEEYKKIYEDHKGTYIVENSHRIRSAMTGGYPGRERVCVFLTDSKVHEKPESIEAKPAKMREVKPYIPEPVNEKAQEFKELKDQLKQGIKIVAAPQLFPTPLELCERMVGRLQKSMS